MAKDTAKTEAKAKQPKRESEAALMAEYDHRVYDANGAITPNTAPIVEGSLRYETEGRYKGKQTVERICAFSGRTFRLATSDLFQKYVDDEAIKEIRKLRAKTKRAAKRAESEEVRGCPTGDDEEIVVDLEEAA